MSSLTQRRARVFGLVGALAGIGLSAALVWQASYSAFSATTANPTNTWAAGSVILVDDDSNTAEFTVSNMKPGDTATHCIVVTSNGSLASTVKMYTTAASFSQTNAMADNMTMTVTQGTSTSTGGTCSSFVADGGAPNTTTGTMTAFSTSYTTFANGFGTWAPAGGVGVKKTYQIVATLNAGAPNTVQSGTAAIGFTWEEQNS